MVCIAFDLAYVPASRLSCHESDGHVMHLDNKKPHEVFNHSRENRIHLIFDLERRWRAGGEWSPMVGVLKFSQFVLRRAQDRGGRITLVSGMKKPARVSAFLRKHWSLSKRTL